MKTKEQRNSGQYWSEKLRIPILDPKGWVSVDDYNHVLITKEEFCNRAANSVVGLNKPQTRREAAKLLQKI